MAILRFKNITKMDNKQVEEKLKELRFTLTRAYVTANKSNAQTKEIKRAIARLLTYSNSKKLDSPLSKSVKEELKPKK